jgi:TRAP-type uncharacterized transport system substrate-binding protein
MLKHLVPFVAFAAVALAGADASAQRDFKWGSSQLGSAGHKAQVIIADVLNKEMPQYRHSVLPTPGAINTVKGYAVGEFDGYYGSDIAFFEMSQDEGRFKGFKAQMKRQPVQSFWTFTLETGLGVRYADRDKYKKWGDLAGKRIFTGPLPFDTRAHLDRAIAALGIKFQYVNVDLSTVGSQLASGAIDATTTYVTAESTPVPWLVEASLAVDWMSLNPSPDEIATLRSKNFGVVELSPTVFKRDTHTDKVVLSPFFYGFHPGMDMPADDLYRMLTILEKQASEMAKSDGSFSQIAKDFAGMQKRGVTAAIDMLPVHPGLARYMREKGVWDAKWDNKIASK